MDFNEREQLEQNKAEGKALLGVAINLLLSDADVPKEDLAYLLMRVRTLLE